MFDLKIYYDTRDPRTPFSETDDLIRDALPSRIQWSGCEMNRAGLGDRDLGMEVETFELASEYRRLVEKIPGVVAVISEGITM